MKRGAGAVLGALLGSMLIACSASRGGGESSAGSVYVFYNNDNFSYLEPCGCRISPIGGMDRRWNAMLSFPEESRIFVDSGNMLFKSPRAADYLAPQWLEQAKGVVEAYNLLHADAATPGENDFALGMEKFEEIAKGAHFPFLSANLYKTETNELFLPDSIILERRGKKIGIFGLYHPSFLLPSGLEARDPIAAAKKEVEKLRAAGAEMVIALAHEGYDNDIKLAQNVKGIDLIVGAHSQSLLQNPDHEGETTIVQLSSEGQMLAYVEYALQGFPKKILNSVVGELNAEFNNPPHGEANPMKGLVAVTNLKMTEANRKLDEALWEKHKSVSMSYDTFLSCRDCHASQAAFQEGKPHSAAFLTLLAAKEEHNLECVKCHSVGLNSEGGFRTMAEAFLDRNGGPVAMEDVLTKAGAGFPQKGRSYRELYRKDPKTLRKDVAQWIAALRGADVKKAFVGVQCENCHGGMSGHPFSADIKSTKVNSDVCVRCHTQELMPSWYDNSGKLKLSLVQAALKEMGCPRNK